LALSDDQRRLLELLAKQDEAYEAIAAATGASVEDLKARAAEAIAALGQEEAAPAAPPAAEASPPRSARQRRQSRPGSSVRLPGNRRLAELLGGGLVVLLLVLFATGTIDIGGGDDSDDGGGGAQAVLDEGLPAQAVKRTPQAVLQAVDGSDASGRALFGRFKQQVLLLLAAKGLEPSPSGGSYAISLVRPGGERIPIAATRVGASGTISGQFQVPANVLGLLASGYEEMEVSLVVNKELEAALQQARTAKVPPEFGGEAVLRGPVTGRIVELGKKGG
jgi:hypothetical protein